MLGWMWIELFASLDFTVFQVLSGGVVLELAVGQTVGLESFKDAQRDTEVNDVQPKQIIFNGFLLY